MIPTSTSDRAAAAAVAREAVDGEAAADPTAAADAVTDGAATDRTRDHRSIGALMTRNLITQGLALARQLVVLPLISPGELGLFRYVSQLCGYSVLFHFGAMSIFRVRYPEWQAAGRDRDCAALQTVAWRQVGIGAALFGPLLALVLLTQSELPVWMVAVVALAGVAPLYADYATSSFNVRGRFDEVARLDVLVAFVASVALLVGVLAFGIRGLIIASLIGPVLRCTLAREFFRPRPIVVPERDERRGMALFGARVWFSTVVTRTSNTCDIIVLGALLGETSAALGTYALAVTICNLLSQDVRAVSLVHLRSLQVAIGRAGRVAAPAIRRQTREYASLDSYIGILVSCLAVAATAVAVPLLIPRHAGVVTMLGPIACAVVLLRVRRYTAQNLSQLDRSGFVVATALLQTGLMIGGFIVLTHVADIPIRVYGLVFAGAVLVSTSLENVIAHALMGSMREGIGFAGRLLFAIAPLLLGVGLAPLWITAPIGVAGMAIAALVLATATYWLVLDRAPRRALELFGEVLRGKLRKFGKLVRRVRKQAP